MNISRTIYPLSYNKNLKRGTVAWANAFNKWATYIKSETMDDAIIYQVRRILQK